MLFYILRCRYTNVGL